MVSNGKIKSWLLVSSPARVEPRSHQSILTTSKTWTLNNSSQILKRSEVTGQIVVPQIRERQAGTESITTYQSKNSRAEASPETSAGMGKPELWLMNHCRLSVDNSWVLKIPGGPHAFRNFTSRSLTWFSQWISEIKPLLLPAGGGQKEPFLKCSRTFCSSQHGWPSGEDI